MFADHLEFLLSSLGYQDLRATYERRYLIENASHINSEHLRVVTDRDGKLRNWERATSNRALDLVYGLDYIIEIEPSHRRIGLNFSTNPDDIRNRVDRAENLMTLWKSIGISQAIVLLAIYPDVESQGLIFYDLDKSIDELYERLMAALDSERDVSSAEVRIQVE